MRAAKAAVSAACRAASGECPAEAAAALSGEAAVEGVKVHSPTSSVRRTMRAARSFISRTRCHSVKR